MFNLSVKQTNKNGTIKLFKVIAYGLQSKKLKQNRKKETEQNKEKRIENKDKFKLWNLIVCLRIFKKNNPGWQNKSS